MNDWMTAFICFLHSLLSIGINALTELQNSLHHENHLNVGRPAWLLADSSRSFLIALSLTFLFRWQAPMTEFGHQYRNKIPFHNSTITNSLAFIPENESKDQSSNNFLRQRLVMMMRWWVQWSVSMDICIFVCMYVLFIIIISFYSNRDDLNDEQLCLLFGGFLIMVIFTALIIIWVILSSSYTIYTVVDLYPFA